MTDAQKFRFYFPAWTACVKANGWHMEKSRLVLDATRACDEFIGVHTFARQRALQAGRGLTADDLRHGCHWLALGRDKSSADLTNAQVDRIVTLFKLLTDPDDLDARLGWDAYARGEDPGAVRRVEWFIRRCPDAYVRAVAHGIFGVRDWESLTIAQKKKLCMTLANRRPKQPGRGAKDEGREPEPEPVAAENEPF